MKFNKNASVGALIGFFIVSRTITDLLNGKLYSVLDAVIDLSLAIIMGFLLGILDGGNK